MIIYSKKARKTKAYKAKNPRSFAWFPKKLNNGTIIWLEHYTRSRVGRTYR